MKLSSCFHAISATTIFPRRRRAIKPVSFVAHSSDKAALSVDFAQIGNDMRKAMDRYETFYQLSR